MNKLAKILITVSNLVHKFCYTNVQSETVKRARFCRNYHCKLVLSNRHCIYIERYISSDIII